MKNLESETTDLKKAVSEIKSILTSKPPIEAVPTVVQTPNLKQHRNLLKRLTAYEYVESLNQTKKKLDYVRNMILPRFRSYWRTSSSMRILEMWYGWGGPRKAKLEQYFWDSECLSTTNDFTFCKKTENFWRTCVFESTTNKGRSWLWKTKFNAKTWTNQWWQRTKESSSSWRKFVHPARHKMDQEENTRSPRALLINHLHQHSYLQCQKYIRIWPTNLFLQCHNITKSLPYRNVADWKCQRQCNFPRQHYNTPKRPTKCKGGYKTQLQKLEFLHQNHWLINLGNTELIHWPAQ